MRPCPFAPTRSIVLVGLMGAGKSCVGRRLAARFKLPFRDADDEIERAAGLKVAEIFAQYGEAEFRRGERRVIERLLEGPICVLATGGGAFMDPASRGAIGAAGVSVWLRADLDLLVQRTAGRSHRPLLNGVPIRQKLKELMDLRYPVYAEADIVIDSRAESPDLTAGRVVDALRAWATPAQAIPA